VKRKKHLYSVVLVLALAGCGGSGPGTPGNSAPSSNATDAGKQNVAGTHRDTLSVGGLTREAIVYVPARAAGTAHVPAVFLFHGTGGSGQGFYNISGWREKADAEGFIAVFPSALTYCLKEDENGDGDFNDRGERSVTTKWAAGQLGTATMPQCSAAEVVHLTGTTQKLVDHPVADDVAYVDAMLDLLASSYVVDAKRIYASGFSNGGQMTSRLVQERASRFGAIAAAAGPLYPDAVPAGRPISVVFSLGTIDEKFTPRLGVSQIPISPTLFTDVPQTQTILNKYLVMLQLKNTFTFTLENISGRKVGRYTFAASTAGAANTLTVLIIDGLNHAYPNGKNCPIVLADTLWPLFSSQSLP
jgi:poly(3-hydroxybutyrate) depolymerase